MNDDDDDFEFEPERMLGTVAFACLILAAILAIWYIAKVFQS
jgi:hypothetical protein